MNEEIDKMLRMFSIMEACVPIMEALERQGGYAKHSGHTSMEEKIEKSYDAVFNLYQEAGREMPDMFWEGRE